MLSNFILRTLPLMSNSPKLTKINEHDKKKNTNPDNLQPEKQEFNSNDNLLLTGNNNEARNTDIHVNDFLKTPPTTLHRRKRK